MKPPRRPGRPERIFLGVTALLALSGLCCMAIGYTSDQLLVLDVGRYLGIFAIALACLPLALFLVMLIVEKIWSR